MDPGLRRAAHASRGRATRARTTSEQRRPRNHRHGGGQRRQHTSALHRSAFPQPLSIANCYAPSSATCRLPRPAMTRWLPRIDPLGDPASPRPTSAMRSTRPTPISSVRSPTRQPACRSRGLHSRSLRRSCTTTRRPSWVAGIGCSGPRLTADQRRDVRSSSVTRSTFQLPWRLGDDDPHRPLPTADARRLSAHPLIRWCRPIGSPTSTVASTRGLPLGAQGCGHAAAS